MIKLYVIIPDKSSGDAFNDVLRKNGISTEYDYHKIHPRVIDNKITTSNDIAQDMNRIFKTFTDKTRSVVIACNTLQLWLKDIDPKNKSNVKIYTTFEACEWKFKNLKNKPIWLGTTPLVERTTNFPTLLSYHDNYTQDLVQELIWRIKMFYGDEIGTASESVKRDQNNKKIQQIKIKAIRDEIFKNIKQLGVKRVILGCTELPMIFTKEKENGIHFYDPAQILAEYIKSQSVTLVFAGGTISSAVNKKGVKVGGEVFDLLEKLSGKIPGSYKSLNITKSEILYSGLSEDMTSKDHFRILTSVKEILETGVSRIVITHGTDSMEQTARFLSKQLSNKLISEKTNIVLTGANDHTGSKQTDAWDNLQFAINGKIKNRFGVYIAFGGSFINANKAVKDIFDGKQMKYIDKNSKQYKDNLKKFNLKADLLISNLKEKMGSEYEHYSVIQYDVNVIRKNHNEFLEAIEKGKIKAVLFNLYHSGTANTNDKESSVSKLVSLLNKKGIVSFGATENGEHTDLRAYKTSIDLLESGMVPLRDMILPVALAKLKLINIDKNNLKPKDVIKLMLKNIVGEITSS